MKGTLLALLVAVALMLAGCGGSSKTASIGPPPPPPPPDPVPITGLPTGHTLTSGTIPAGGTRTVAEAGGIRTTLTCPAGGAACNIMVASDGSVTSTGGEPTVATVRVEPDPPPPVAIEGLPTDHRLASGVIPAGELRVIHDGANGRTTLTCPADGEDCNIMVASDGSATSTGGTPIVQIVPVMPGVEPDTNPGGGTPITGLPTGHMLASGVIPAGETRTIHEASGMRTTITCSAGGPDCNIMVASDGSATSTGGALVVATTTTMPGVEPDTNPGITPPPVNRGLLSRIEAWHDSRELWSHATTYSRDSSNVYPSWIGGASVANDYTSLNRRRPYRIERLLETAILDYGANRFSGSSTLEDGDGNSHSANFWGGWLDNAIFIVEFAETPGIYNLGFLGDKVHGFGSAQGNLEEGPSAPFELNQAYRGRAVDIGGRWANAGLRLSYTTNPSASSGRSPTATLWMDFIDDIPGHAAAGGTDQGRMDFPPILVGSARYSGIYGGSKDVQGDERDIRPGNAEGPYYYGITFTGFEGGHTGGPHIAGYFHRIHMGLPPDANQHSYHESEHGDRSKDTIGAFGVTPDN